MLPLLVLVSACATLDLTPDVAAPHEATVSVGSYLNMETPTEVRLAALLDAHGIKWGAACSLGCTLFVDESRADETRQVLRDAIANEHLRVSVIDAP